MIDRAVRAVSCLFLMLLQGACGSAHERPQFAQHTPSPHQALLGTAHPYTLESAAWDGSYIVLCQARRDTNKDGQIKVSLGLHGDTYGDQLEPYFIRKSGPGDRFDELIAIGDRDRFLIAVQRPDLRLIDTHTGDSAILRDADVDNRVKEARLLDPKPSAQAVFGVRGGKIAYKKRNTEQIVIGIVDLNTREEKEISAGPGALGSFFFDASEQWLIVEKVTEDTNKNGRIEFPANWTTLAPDACRGPVSSFSVRPGRGDAITFWALSIQSGQLTQTPEGWVDMLGEHMLIRKPDDTLAAIASDGTETILAGPECGARIRWAADNPRRLLLACKKTSELVFITPGGTQVLKQLKHASRSDVLRWQQGPLIRLEDNGLEFLIDIEKGRVLEFSPGEYAVTTHDKHVLVMSKQSLVLMDAETQTRTPLPLSNLPKDTYMEWKSGPMVAIAGHIIDMQQGRITGRYTAPILGIDSQGRILKAANIFVSGFELPRGPLFWEKP